MSFGGRDGGLDAVRRLRLWWVSGSGGAGCGEMLHALFRVLEGV